MQNELINRRAMIESITNHMNKPENEDVKEVYESFIKFLNEQPIAYDVDAVVEQLKTEGKKMSEAKSRSPFGKHSPANHRYYKAISVKRAEMLVRAGGKE